jgi:hypothetical protein
VEKNRAEYFFSMLKKELLMITAPAKEITLHGTRFLYRTLKSCYVAKSLIPQAGCGVFLSESADAGELVTEYGGNVVDRESAEALLKSSQDTHLRSISLGREALDGREQGLFTIEGYYAPNNMLGSFVNDFWGSGKPANAEFWLYDHCGTLHPSGQYSSGRIFIRLLTDLPAGSEVLVSYGKSYRMRHFV